MKNITREHQKNGTVVLISHIHGQGTMQRSAGGGVKWAVRFATVDVPLVFGDERVLLDHAMKRGEPLTVEETRAILLERRLAPPREDVLVFDLEMLEKARRMLTS